MPINMLPTPASPLARTPVHTRTVRYQVFARADGLWDVEGSLHDVKEVALQRLSMPPLAPGDSVHHMLVVVTVDDELRIHAVESDLRTTPFGECQQARAPLQRLIGARLGKGWRRTLEDAMGGVAGCTHLRELLMNLATAAIQGVNSYRDQQRAEQGLPPLGGDAVPHFIGGCISWRREGPVVQRLFPQFAIDGPRPDAPP